MSDDDDRRELQQLDAMIGPSEISEMFSLAADRGGPTRAWALLLETLEDEKPLPAATVLELLAQVAWRTQLIACNLAVPEDGADRIAALEQRLDAMEAKLDHIAEVVESSRKRVGVAFGTPMQSAKRWTE